jgi:hypothetical protein
MYKQRADELANERGDVLLEEPAPAAGLPGSSGRSWEAAAAASSSSSRGCGCSWGMWVNTSKNPRFKLIEMPQLQLSIEIPKSIALANVALRVQVGCCGCWVDRTAHHHAYMCVRVKGLPIVCAAYCLCRLFEPGHCLTEFQRPI